MQSCRYVSLRNWKQKINDMKNKIIDNMYFVLCMLRLILMCLTVGLVAIMTGGLILVNKIKENIRYNIPNKMLYISLKIIIFV